MAANTKSSEAINLNKGASTYENQENVDKARIALIKLIQQNLTVSFAKYVLGERKIYDRDTLKKNPILQQAQAQKTTGDQKLTKSDLDRSDLGKMNPQAWFSMKHVDGMIRTHVGTREHLRNVVAVFPIFNEEILRSLIEDICKTQKVNNPEFSRGELFYLYLQMVSLPGLVGNFAKPQLTVETVKYFVIPIHVQGSQYAVTVVTTHANEPTYINYYNGLNGEIPIDFRDKLDDHFKGAIFQTIPCDRAEEGENSSVYIALKAIDIIHQAEKIQETLSDHFDPKAHQKRVKTFKLILSNALPNENLAIKYDASFARDIEFQQNELVIACHSIYSLKELAKEAEKAKNLCQQVLISLIREPTIPPKPRVNEKGERVKITITSGHTLTSDEILVRCKRFRQKLQSMRARLEKKSDLTKVESDFLVWVLRTMLAFDQATEDMYEKLKPKKLERKPVAPPPKKQKRIELDEPSIFNRMISWVSQKRQETSIWFVNSSWKTITFYCITIAAIVLIGTPLILALGAHCGLYIPVEPLLTFAAGSVSFILGLGVVSAICNKVDLSMSEMKLVPSQQEKNQQDKKEQNNKMMKEKVNNTPIYPKDQLKKKKQHQAVSLLQEEKLVSLLEEPIIEQVAAEVVKKEPMAQKTPLRDLKSKPLKNEGISVANSAIPEGGQTIRRSARLQQHNKRRPS